ncbi:MAG: hypothetical protein HC936_14845 [Leptolyngbyaceae cyanobacterium SU_3_3]|nr:hypothetical protein [Leptolyngbyaceae cyanobacterium SU_3_3]
MVAKLEHQLLKVKGKLDSRLHGGPKAGHHHSNGLHTPPVAAVALLDAPAAVEEDENVAKIVRRKQFEVTAMTAEDAALRMDLLQHDFYLFTNI